MGPLIGAILSLAAFYSLLAAGYVIVYRGSRILNFAHGELMMLGGYFAFSMVTIIEAPPVIGIALSLIVSLALGITIYLLVMRRMIGEPLFAAVIVTIGLSIIFQGLATCVWGVEHRYLNTAMGMANRSWELPFGLILSTFDTLTIIGAIVFLGFLFVFLKMTRLGTYMRAAAENPLLAAQGGVNVYLIFALSWGLATLGAAFAGILYGGNVFLEPSVGFLGLLALPVALTGGMGSLAGIVPAAIIIATAQVLGMRYGGPLLNDVMPMFIMLLVLIIRPWGLFGTKEEIERL